MRRLLAILLLALLGSPAIVPLLAADPVSNLPACCRRGGKHQCAMMAFGSDRSSDAALRPARCAAYPNLNLGPSIPFDYLAASPGGFCGGLVSIAVRGRESNLRARSAGGSHRERGPPQLLS